jgi:hypothetical protein
VTGTCVNHTVFIFQLVMEDIQITAKQLMKAQHSSDFESNETGKGVMDMGLEQQQPHTIPAIHLAFRAAGSRLNLFAQLAQAWPDSVKTVAECKMVSDKVCLSFYCSHCFSLPVKFHCRYHG